MTITVHPPPVVNFSASDTTVCPGAPVTFTSSSTGGAPGPMVYSWNYGDGSPTGSGVSSTHAYSLPGFYTVALFVTNTATSCVASLVRSSYIEVYTPPIPNFSWSPFGVCNPPGTVTFSSSSTGTGPLSCAWTFGDGGTGAGTPASYLYATVGSYNPKLVVTDGHGCKDSVTLGPVIADTIRAEFSYPTTACVFAPVVFSNTSSTHVSRTWNFGDGSLPVTTFNGYHTYSTPGLYTVTLTINNPPCSHTVTHVINIVTGPAADFIISPTDPCPAPATITYSSVGPGGTIYNWLFEGGATAAGSPVSHTYTTNGIKTIKMIAIDPVTGCRDTVIKTDSIVNIYIFNAVATPYEGCVPLAVDFHVDLTCSIPFVGTYPYPVVSYTWDFVDGSPTVSGPTPSHTFTAVGIYFVTVTAITSNGCTVNDVVEIRVGKPPVVAYTASPLHVCYGSYTPIHFVPTIVTGPVDEWRWLFGEGSSSIIFGPFAVPVDCIYTLPGLFTPTLTPFYLGCEGPTFTITDYVLIDSPKSIIKDSFLCSPRTRVLFTNLSLGDDSHLWIFGDGTTSTEDTVIHVFPAIAVYTVKLATYNNASGCHDTATKIIDLIPPVMNIVASDTVVCKNDTISFTGSGYGGGFAVYYHWGIMDTGGVMIDSTSYSLYNYPYVRSFTTTGRFGVQFVVIDEHVCHDTFSRPNYVQVGTPAPNFSGSPVSGCVPLNVVFTDASIPAYGTSLSSYAWSFGDGSSSTVTTPITSHTYTAAGTYTLWEIVSDNIGCVDSIERPAYITAYDPVASFTAPNTHPCLNVPATFTNTSTGGTLTSLWDFGDGGSSTTMSPVHAYTAVGSYTVKLTVTDSHGCTDVAIYTAYINVSQPAAGFTMSDSASVCPPLFVNFTNTSTGGSTYNWVFGDGGGSVVLSPSNMYIASGMYPVRLIVTNAYGCKDTVIHPVNIFGYAGSFTYTPLQGCAPFAVHFSATLSNIPFITWDFSDGVTSAVSFTDTMTHIYTTPGAYVPKLLLSDNTGCQTSNTGLDTIKVDAINTKFSTFPSPVCINTEFSFIDSSTTFWSPITTWAWTYDGNTSSLPVPTHTIGIPGSYPVTLTVTNGWGCTGVLTADLVVNPPPDVTASADTIVCVGDPAILMGYGALTYTWSPPATLSCTACNPTNATPSVETTYVVTGTDGNGCIDTASVTVGLRTHTISKAWGDTAVCQGVPVPLFDTGGTSYLWLPPLGLSSNTIYNPIATPPYTTIYTVIARVGSCIPDTNQVTLLIWPLPVVDAGPSQRLLAGSTAQLLATGTDIVTYLWSPGESLSCTDCYNPVASMSVTTTYNVDVLSSHGCKASDSVRILLYCDNSMLYMPTAFTPNGDGQNDVFYPRGIGLKTIKTFRIYNRWGEMIFERSGINLNDESNGWDGTYKGDTPHADVYVYVLEGICYTGEDVHLKGDVTIIR
jgi:gliding motility-associated-like protein